MKERSKKKMIKTKKESDFISRNVRLSLSFLFFFGWVECFIQCLHFWSSGVLLAEEFSTHSTRCYRRPPVSSWWRRERKKKAFLSFHLPTFLRSTKQFALSLRTKTFSQFKSRFIQNKKKKCLWWVEVNVFHNFI